MRHIALAVLVLASTLTILAGGSVAPPPEAAAATGDFKVTLVALECPPTPSAPGVNDYALVRANRARNNIMETLKNLGPNTNYNSQMNPPVNPANESAAPQDQCSPIVNWPITFGNRIDGKSPAPLNYLSKVGGVSGTYRTLASTPELDSAGNPTGNTLQGAITVPLTDAQAALAGNNSLWVMGGTPNDPLGEAVNGFGPANYAFGALRCAVDALNGDNVEWVGFRGSTRHVFCYAIYLNPPEPNGQITIRKSVTGGQSGGEQFGFQGDISFNPGGTFTLADGGVFSERRSVGDWYVEETGRPPGWTLDDITCSTSGAGTSAVPNVGTGRVDMTLGQDGSIDCTYVNRPPPPPPPPPIVLGITKVTEGGVGSFDFDVTGPGGFSDDSILTTTQPGVGVQETFSPVDPGTYTMTETPPAASGGSWTVTSVECFDQTGADVAVGGAGTTRTVDLGVGQSASCVWTNTFTPTADLVIRAKTYGGTNAAINYLTLGYDPAAGECDPGVALFDQDADTSGDPDGTTFHVATGDSTSGIPVGTYCIAGTRPTEGADPGWVAKSVTCEGDIDYSAPYNTSTEFYTAIVQPLPGGTVTCDFVYVLRSTIDVTKTVSAGNSLRDGPVTVSLTCAQSAAADPDAWPKVLTLGAGETSATLSGELGGTIYVDGDDTGEDECTVTETATGAAGAQEPPTITPAWNGAAWTAASQQLPSGSSASLAGSSASNSQAVTVALDSGPCSLSGTSLTATAASGTCELSFAVAGNPGAVNATTAWSISDPDVAGTGLSTGAFPIVAGGARVVGFTDSYEATAVPVTVSRTVDLVPASPSPDNRGAGGGSGSGGAGAGMLSMTGAAGVAELVALGAAMVFAGLSLGRWSRRRARRAARVRRIRAATAAAMS